MHSSLDYTLNHIFLWEKVENYKNKPLHKKQLRYFRSGETRKKNVFNVEYTLCSCNRRRIIINYG